MDKKYQIFISSTYSDLIEERKKIQDTILSMFQFPVGMELFSATDAEQWDVIKRTIDTSDYYVLIIGNRYGTVIESGEDAGISYTEKEYRYAVSKGIPVHAFLISNDADTKTAKMESDPKKKRRLEKFIKEVKNNRLVEWWTDKADLSQKVMNSLFKELLHSTRPGWIRGDAIDAEKRLREMTALSERIRCLEEENKQLLLENQKYRQETSSRYPKLILHIYGDSPKKDSAPHRALYQNVDFLYENDDGSILIRMKPVYTAAVEAEYEPLSKDDFVGELRGQVTEQEIEEYNKALPGIDEMQTYLKEYIKFCRIKESGLPICICIQNEGSAKATDISITLEFPNELLVFDIDEVDDIEEPKRPKKSRNLLEIAYGRAHASEMAIREMYSQMELLAGAERMKIPFISPLGISSGYDYVSVSENTVDVELREGIVHTKGNCVKGAYIVPLEQGRFYIKATIMCAEYKEPDVRYIEVVCKQIGGEED